MSSFEAWFYYDSDEDGWGDPGTEPIVLEEAGEEQFYTATNGIDCDDGDAFITGRVGAGCPEHLVTADSPEYYGFVFEQSEFVFVHGDTTPVVRYTEAETACTGWGGMALDLETEELSPAGHLATFLDSQGVSQAEAAIEAKIDTSQGFAVFLGTRWNGTSWEWVDGTDPGVIGVELPFCRLDAPYDFESSNPPAPSDFWPHLYEDDADAADFLAQELDRVRLAWVRRANGQWCLGMPWMAWSDTPPEDGPFDENGEYAGPELQGDERYGLTKAHFLCERSTPDPSQYRQIPMDDATEE